MTQTPFKSEEIDDAKAAFAIAWRAEIQNSPFKPDPFRAAICIWNEENGELPRALWVAHAAKWHEDEAVLQLIQDAKDDEAAEDKNEKLAKAEEMKSEEFKALIKLEIITAMRKDLNSISVEPKDRKDAADRLCKLLGLDEKPDPGEADAGKILGVIHHRLSPLTPSEFEDAVGKQQGALQHELIDLAATDVTRIN